MNLTPALTTTPSRLQRSWWLLALALVLAIPATIELLAPGTLSKFGTMGREGSRAGISSLASTIRNSPAAANLLSMLSNRSPGERTKGELADTKARRVAMAMPHQRALAKVQPPAKALPESFIKPLFAPQPTVGPAVVPTTVVAEAPPLAAAPPLGGGVPGVPGIFAPPPIGGVGPGPSAPPTVPPTEVVPPPAVPEPSTWAMMLFGFGAIGLAMRRRRFSLRGTAATL